MKYIGLRMPYIAVETPLGLSYGGDQNQLERQTLRQGGCGLIAAADLLRYLGDEPNQVDEKTYKDQIHALERRYFPVLLRVGKTSSALTAGLNAYFLVHRLPYSAFPGVLPGELFSKMREMLEADIPVILVIGPNFPNRMAGKKLALYSPLPAAGEDRPVVVSAASAHFVTVTGMDREWLHISSWGKSYRIRKHEYRKYVREHSSYMMSNIIYVKKKGSVRRKQDQ